MARHDNEVRVVKKDEVRTAPFWEREGDGTVQVELRVEGFERLAVAAAEVEAGVEQTGSEVGTRLGHAGEGRHCV